MSQLAVNLHEKVEQFLQGTKKLYVNGTFVESVSGKTFKTPNPATGETLAIVSEAGREDIHKAVMAARQAFDEGILVTYERCRAQSLDVQTGRLNGRT